MPYVNGRYLNDEELRGYEAAQRYHEGGYENRYGSYDYEQGWRRQEDDSRCERHRQEERERERAEELAAERRAHEHRMGEEAQYEAYCSEMDAQEAQERQYVEDMERAQAEAECQEQEDMDKA